MSEFGIRSAVALTLAAGLLATGCSSDPFRDSDPNEPWPDEAAERDARIAAAGRSTCKLVGVRVSAKPAEETGSDRDSLEVIVETTQDPVKKAAMRPYENYMPTDESTAGRNPATVGSKESDGERNPHASRVVWQWYSPNVVAKGKIPVARPQSAYRSDYLEDNSVWVSKNPNAKDRSPTDSFIIIPRDDYKAGDRMTVSMTSEVTSTIREDQKSHPFDKEFTRVDHVKAARGIRYCGELVQVGDDDKGAKGWVVDAVAKLPADFVKEYERDETFDCNSDDVVEMCYSNF